MKPHLSLVAGLWCLAVAAAAPAAWAQTTYGVVEIPVKWKKGNTPAGGTVLALNDRGKATAQAWDQETFNEYSFVCGATGGKCKPLVASDDTKPQQVGALAINNAGVVAGYTRHDGLRQATRWDGGVPTVLPPLVNAKRPLWSSAYAVTRSGDVVGAGYTHPQLVKMHGAIWSNGGVTMLPNFDDVGSGAAYAANDQGLIVGWAQEPVAHLVHAVYWQDQAIHDITPAGATAQAFAVDGSGRMAGCGNMFGADHAFLRGTDGALQDLGVLAGHASSCATGMNDAGQTVGWSQAQSDDFPNPTRRGVLFEGGAVVDLNTRISAADQAVWEIREATAINEQGQIGTTAIRRSDGLQLPVVLVPQTQ